MSKRYAWLDVLRATAVLGVVAFHVVQMSPLGGTRLAQVTQYGAFGVDLFFVLSGWLIGSLLWNELTMHDNVHLMTFWARRALRTVPPYLVAVLLSWGAVAYARQEPFDWGYLFFLQNYYQRIPFFLVSWSLCIEEHFYAVAPIVAALLLRSAGLHGLWLGALLLMALSPLARGLEYKEVSDFGYSVTATHLRLDGLVVGFFGSYFCSRDGRVTLSVAQAGWARLGLVGSVGALIGLEALGGHVRYVLFPTALALGFGFVVVYGLDRADAWRGQLMGHWSIRAIALASYSIYLMHPLAIHVARGVVRPVEGTFGVLYWPVAIAAIAVMSGLFYWFVERTSIEARDALVPRRERPALRTSQSIEFAGSPERQR